MLTLIGIVVIIVATIQAYRAAQSTGRNAGLWIAATLVAGIGLQIVLPIIGVMIYGIVMLLGGTTEPQLQSTIEGPATVISLIGLVLSFVAIWLILRHLSKIPEESSSVRPPAPPRFE